MHILFVSSGNTEGGISPLVKNQGDSLKKEGHQIDFFTVKGNGMKGYLKAIFQLRKRIKHTTYDLIHAHYGLSAISALLGKRDLPMVVSFMGDDLIGSNRKDGRIKKISLFLSWLNRWLAKKKYSYTIVKSSQMFDLLNIPNAVIIPNGVDLDLFYPEDKKKDQNPNNC